jgi:hypothetical protein
MERDDLFKIPIEGFENYKITKCGKIWSDKTKKYLKTQINNGYQTFKSKSLHRLIAIVFISNPNNYPIVDHINENKLDNRICNLQWITQKGNINKCPINTSHSRKVQQIKDNKVIKTFDTVTQASEYMNLSRSAISKACLGINKSAGGYQWKYIIDQHQHTLVDLTNAKKIYDFDNYYVFEDGQIYNKKRKSFLKPVENLKGYCYVTLSKNCKKKNYYIHVIVAENFIEKKRDETFQVNHINKIRNDNRLSNLEIVTNSENMLHAYNYKGFCTNSS